MQFDIGCSFNLYFSEQGELKLEFKLETNVANLVLELRRWDTCLCAISKKLISMIPMRRIMAMRSLIWRFAWLEVRAPMDTNRLALEKLTTRIFKISPINPYNSLRPKTCRLQFGWLVWRFFFLNQFFPFGRVNFIFDKLSGNTKYIKFRLRMSPWWSFVQKWY
jgi:hypothetical protein